MFRYIVVIVIVISTCVLSSYSQSENMKKIDSLIDYGANISSSNHLKALGIIDSALKLSKQSAYRKGEAEALRKKGLALFYAINYNEALQLFLASKAKSEEIHDQFGVANANNLIAIVYSYHGRNEKSLELHKENLILREKIKDSSGISTTLNNIGVQLGKLNRFNEALFYYQKAINIEILENDLASISRYYDNIGTIFLKLNKPDSAYYFINKSLEIRKKINDRQGIKDCYESLGEYYSNIRDYSTAKKYQEQSLKIAYEIGIVYEIESVTSQLGKTYAKLGDYKQAFEMLSINKIMSDSLKANETTESLNALEIQKALASERKIQQLLDGKTESERKIQQIIYTGSIFILTGVVVFTLYHLNNKKIHNKVLLEQQEKILVQSNKILSQNEKLEKVNSEKDKFFSIIAHDLKNPLGNFREVTKLLADSYNEFTEEDRLEFLNLMKDSSKNIYDLLENLLDWSRSQRGQILYNPVEINLKLVATEIIQLLKHAAEKKSISIESHIISSIQIIADLNMIQTIIRNLISNAIKFTPENGIISINANIAQNQCEISIKDTGIGMSQNVIEKLFRIDENVTTRGTSGEVGTGLGLILCKEFIEKHDGSIWVESNVGKGSTFHIILPI